MKPMTIERAIEQYNKRAAFYGWLPIGITLTSSNRTLYDASERCSSLFSEISKAIKEYTN